VTGQPMSSWIRAGLAAAATSIFLAAVGLIERFRDLNLVGEEVTFAGLVMAVVPFGVGYVLARPRIERGERREVPLPRAALVGAVAGIAAGLGFGAAAVAVDAFGVDRVRAVFLNVTEGLIELVTFGLPPVAGAGVLAVMSGALGALGGAYRRSPERWRRPLGTAVVAVLVLGFLQRIVPIALDQLNLERDWLYSRRTGGLTWPGAALAAVVAVLASVVKARLAERWRDLADRGGSEGAEPFGGLRLRTALFVAGLIGVAALPQVVGSVVSEVLGTVMVFALLGLGLNIVVGYAGLLDLGYVFFFATGAYTLALLTGATLNTFTGQAEPALSAELGFYLAIPIVIALAAATGLLIGAPVLRLRGDYLALVTLGLGEMVTVLVKSPWLTPLVGGPNGMRNVTDAALFGFGFRSPQHFYYLGLAFVLLALVVSHRLAASRIGRAWTAMREDEQIADAMGVNVVRYKLLAFAMGGAIGSLGGALFAVKIGSLTPASFEVIVSIQVLGLVILGGLGSLPGVVVGALVLVGLPGLLREFEEYRFLAYGAALVGIMALRPQGLVPNVRRMRELREEERAQDAWARASIAQEREDEEEYEEPPVEPAGGELRP
jgi:branched-chain amino acid transport system permease protein